MKQFLLVAFILSLLFFSKLAYSQDFNYQRAYSDYVYSFDIYKKSYSEYELARLNYLQDKSLTSTQKAQSATAAMLTARDEVLRTYLTAVRMKLKETMGLGEREKEPIYQLIDAEHKWFEDHKKQISASDSLEELVNESDEVRDRYNISEIAIYKGLTYISLAKVNNFQSKIEKTNNELKNKVSQIEANKDKNTSTVKRWLSEVENRLSLSQSKEAEAINLINTMSEKRQDKKGIYNDSQSTLSESYLYLKEAVNYLKQVIIEVKTAD